MGARGDRARGACRGDHGPDGAQDGVDEAALAELSSFLARFVRILNPAFDRIRKARDESRCLYVARAFPWTFIVGFFMRLGSRNCMDANRNGGWYADEVLKLAQQDEWPEGEDRTAPCSQGCCDFLSWGCTAALERALVDIVCHMIRPRSRTSASASSATHSMRAHP